MLRYLIAVTEALLSAGCLTGMLFACVFLRWGAGGRRAVAAGALAGVAGAIVMAVLKNTTSRIITGLWNLRIFSLSLAALLAWYIVSLPPLRKKAAPVGAGAAGVLAFTFLLYALPDVLASPYTFSLGTESVFSTVYLYRLIGWLLGLLLMIVTTLAVNRVARRTGEGITGAALNLALLVNALLQVGKIIQVLLTRRIVASNHTLFTIARYSSNYSDYFIYGVLILTLILPLALFARSCRVNEPYENPAQHRKIRAFWRNGRRWAALTLVCFLISTLTLTALAAISNRPVELSPTEDCEVRGDNVYVTLEQVEDGHLHRFAYSTPNGVNVRFIVIKKPNSSAYGIGLDACDICGETGYYERNGQIVCNLCDVVMNVNTIGFKGGCNPIVIDYSIDSGHIIVPIATLMEHEKEFK